MYGAAILHGKTNQLFYIFSGFLFCICKDLEVTRNICAE